MLFMAFLFSFPTTFAVLHRGRPNGNSSTRGEIPQRFACECAGRTEGDTNLRRASERIHGAGGMTLDAAAAAAAAAASLTSGADRWPLVSEWRSRRRRHSAV